MLCDDCIERQKVTAPEVVTPALVPANTVIASDNEVSSSTQAAATTSGPKRKRAPTRKVIDTKETATAKRAKSAAAASKKSNLADQQSQNSATFAALKSTRQAENAPKKRTKAQIAAEKAMEAEADKENAPGA